MANFFAVDHHFLEAPPPPERPPPNENELDEEDFDLEENELVLSGDDALEEELEPDVLGECLAIK